MADEREKASPGADDEPEKTVPFFVTDDDQTSRLWHEHRDLRHEARHSTGLGSPGNTATFAISGDRPPALVGRRRELSWLRTRLEQCTHGFAHMVLIEGEPGIGKTRLARELLDDARRAGIRAITGRCYEQLDLAYLPLRESLFPTLLDEFAQRSGYERELALLRRIEGESDAVDLSGDLSGAFDIPVADRDSGALGREPSAGGGSDSTCPAGDDRDTPFETHGVSLHGPPPHG